MVVTPAVEDYLKAVYGLVSREGPTTTSEVAARVGVSPPSASAMLKRLDAAGLVHRPGRRVDLTEHGRDHALRVVRRHRLLETFLADVLQLPWDEVDAEADVLEHAVSERLVRRIDELLGLPTHDPHGDPIPRPDGGHDERWGPRLTDVPPGSRVRIDRVSDRHGEALRYLAGVGIRPGVTVEVEGRAPFAGPLSVRVGDGVHALGEPLARMIHGTVLESADR